MVTLYWHEYRNRCVYRIRDVEHGYLCNEPGRNADPVGLKKCVEIYCPICTPLSENVKFPLELLGMEIRMANERFAKMFELKACKCEHRKTDDLTVSPDECLCIKDKGIGETFCSIYSCPYINKEKEDE